MDYVNSRPDEIYVQIVETEGKMGHAKEELRCLEDAVVREEDVRQILEEFDDLCNALWPEERREGVGVTGEGG